MKLFIDTADTEEIRRAASMGVLDGVTTNPSLIAKTGRPMRVVLEEICDLVDGPVSGEVFATTYDEMLEEARELASIAPNLVVKVPLIADGIRLVKTLSDDGVQTNVTLCFSPLQAVIAAKAGATYISPFVGRLDDVGHDGMGLVEQIVEAYGNYGYETQVLVASVRSPTHVWIDPHGRGRGDSPILGHRQAARAPAHGHRPGAVRRGRQENSQDLSDGRSGHVGPRFSSTILINDPDQRS